MAKAKKAKLFVGVNVGETKILGALVKPSGTIVARKRCPAPQDHTPEGTLSSIIQVVDDVLGKANVNPKALKAIGLAMPGGTDTGEGRVVVAPNSNMSTMGVVTSVEQRFNVPVAMGSDAHLGTLGEKWLGAARHARNAVAIFVGTGIAAGVITDGKLIRGAREAAGNIGHIAVRPGGARCSCGNRGCLQVLASRSAIERDIREAIAAGQETIMTELLAPSREVITCKMLKRALKAKDPLVTKVVRKASQMLGYACLTIRRLFDPDVIVLGGGVIEVCGKFVMPIVRKIVAADALPRTHQDGLVVESELSSDAVVLGAVALAQELVGQSPLQEALETVPDYPKIKYASFGEVAIGSKVYKNDVYIRGDAKVKKRSKKAAKQRYGTSHKIGPEELKKICEGDPKLVIIGMGHTGMAALTSEGEEFLKRKGIAFQAFPNSRAIRAFNRAYGRKAAIIHVTC